MGRRIKSRVCPICKKEFELKSLLSPYKVYCQELSGDKNPTYFCSYGCYSKFIKGVKNERKNSNRCS